MEGGYCHEGRGKARGESTRAGSTLTKKIYDLVLATFVIVYPFLEREGM